MAEPLGWLGIVRLGLVQSAIGAIVVLTNSTLNRVMAVELLLPVSVPAGLVAWHYAVQLSRPVWGHGSDRGRRRTPWIIAGMALLALGAVLATLATLRMADDPWGGTALAVLAYALIGGGVGAAGTSLLALLASRVAPARRPAAAALTWTMMIAGIIVTAANAGSALEPFTFARLLEVALAVAGIAFVVAVLAVWGVERSAPAGDAAKPPLVPFRAALREIWHDALARDFTLFVFVAMLAYSMQDLILEPFAGLVFGYTVGQSTSLSGVQHGGVLAGMILAGLGGTLLRGDKTALLQWATALGCLASAAALLALGAAGLAGPGAALQAIVFALGLANGVFAVAAIGLMMSFAGAGRGGREGVRMGVWGAAQAIAFGLGGFLGAVGTDVLRGLATETPTAFAIVFAGEALLFGLACGLILRLRPAAGAATLQGLAARPT